MYDLPTVTKLAGVLAAQPYGQNPNRPSRPSSRRLLPLYNSPIVFQCASEEGAVLMRPLAMRWRLHDPETVSDLSITCTVSAVAGIGNLYDLPVVTSGMGFELAGKLRKTKTTAMAAYVGVTHVLFMISRLQFSATAYADWCMRNSDR